MVSQFEKITSGTKETFPIKINEGTSDEITLVARKINIKEEKKYHRIVNESLGSMETGLGRTQNNMKTKINFADYEEATIDADIYLIKTCLSVDGFEETEENIEELPSSMIKEISAKLKELNGLENPELVEDEIKKS